MGGGSPKAPRTEQRRRCSYHRMNYPVFSVASLGSRGTWPIELAAKACDRHVFFLGAIAVVRCAMICSRERGCCPGRHSLKFTIYRLGGGCRYCSHSLIATDCLVDIGQVRTCHHASWMKSSTSNRTPPPRACIYPGYHPYPELL